jgi:hypothetical protein
MADTIEIVQGTATTVEIAGLQGPQGPQGATGSGLGTLTTQGDTLYQGASAAQRLPIGTAGQILKVNSGGTAPEWGAAPASGVSSVNTLTGAVVLAAADVSAPSIDNAVQEYNVTGVLLPNGDSGAGVQLTRNTSTPQAPDGSERTFNAEQLIYRRVSGTAQRLDTYLGVKLEWQPVAPTTPTTSGSTGQIAYSDPYFYICVGVNTWRRVPVAAW